jgi:agmatinase
MIDHLQNTNYFMGAQASVETADWVIVGLPYDGTCSYRPGTRFGPNAIREASWGTEVYSPILDKTLDDIRYFDAGDLELPFGNRDEVLHRIKAACRSVLNQQKKWIGLGGEHLVTISAIEAYLEKYPDLCVLQFDAHADLRQEYLGERYSHATVMRRVVDLIGSDRVAQIGIRSGTQEEWQWMRQHHTLMTTAEALKERLLTWAGRPLFITFDLDAFDPSILPGTGTPEPGGLSYKDFVEWVVILQHSLQSPIVGMDFLELSPDYDPSKVSNIVAAKAIREILLLS